TVVAVIFCSLALSARSPQIFVRWPLANAFAVLLFSILPLCVWRLRRVTSFNLTPCFGFEIYRLPSLKKLMRKQSSPIIVALTALVAILSTSSFAHGAD